MTPSRPGLSEAAFARQVDQLAALFGYQLRYHTYDSRHSAKGFPDVVLVAPGAGRLVFLELKSDKGYVTGEQLAWLAGLRSAGLPAYVVRPRDFDALVSGLQHGDWAGLQASPENGGTSP